MRLLQTFISIHKSVKVRPTKYFFLLIGAIVALFLQAYMHNYNIVYIMMFFITAVAGTSTVYGMFNLHPIKVHPLSNERFFATEPANFTVLVQNDATYGCYDLTFTYEQHAKTLASLAPHENVPLSFEKRFAKRGYAVLQEVRLSSLFPLAHEIKTKRFILEHKIVVYPKPYGKSLLEYFAHDLSRHGDISDFDTVTRFTQGESVASIHWASLAKNDTLMSKRFLYEQKQETLAFDFATLGGEVEQRLSQLTLWILECERYRFRFTLRLGASVFDSKRTTTDAILTQLALY